MTLFFFFPPSPSFSSYLNSLFISYSLVIVVAVVAVVVVVVVGAPISWLSLALFVSAR